MLRMLPLLYALAQAPASPLTLEIRVFLGTEEVTEQTRVTIHRAGERSAAVAQAGPHGQYAFTVPQGIYDAQIVREKDGRVLNIRWAERLIVMPYPDEGGRHLEVVNFTNGYGALQIRTARTGGLPDVALFPIGDRTGTAARIPDRRGEGYLLFVVPAGRYDLQVKNASPPAWHADLEVPLDRTRLWVIE